jgi:hypothetical protein
MTRRKKHHTKRITAVIEHQALEPFEPLLKEILTWGFDGGVRALEAAGYKLGDDLVDDKAYECFENGLFLSFAQVQPAIGVTYAELMRKDKQLSEEIKRLRREKSDALTDIEEQAEAIQNRLAILKRLMDGILWVLVPESWIFKHLVFQSHSGTSDPDELMKLVAIATKQNQENKRELHIVTDLTSLVQLGDIIRIRWDEDGLYVRVQEIKTGQVNDRIEDLILARKGTLSPADMDQLEIEHGLSARKQAARMLKQRERFKQIDEIAQPYVLPENHREDKVLQALAEAGKPPGMATYLSLFPDLVAEARKNGISIFGVDDCLFLICVSEKGMNMLGDLKQLPHWVYHFKHPDLECKREEIEALKKEYPLVNLAALNMNHVMSRSPLIWYPKDLVLDVVMGRILVYAQFDLDVFFQMAADANIQLSLITGKEAEEGRRRGLAPMLENPKAYGVKARFSNGRELKLTSSHFRSVYTQLAGPAEIIKFLKNIDEIQQGVE